VALLGFLLKLINKDSLQGVIMADAVVMGLDDAQKEQTLEDLFFLFFFEKQKFQPLEPSKPSELMETFRSLDTRLGINPLTKIVKFVLEHHIIHQALDNLQRVTPDLYSKVLDRALKICPDDQPPPQTPLTLKPSAKAERLQAIHLTMLFVILTLNNIMIFLSSKLTDGPK